MDANDAMKKALAYVPPDEIFMTGQLNRFIKVLFLKSVPDCNNALLQAKAKKVAVKPSMVVPSVLAAIANTMNHAEVKSRS